VTDFISYNIET